MNTDIERKTEGTINGIIISWIDIALPVVGAIKTTVEGVHSISDDILYYKLYRVLRGQDIDQDNWIRLSERIEEDGADYKKTVRQLVYYINAINEENLLEAFSNLLKAYMKGFINRSDFFRLAFALTNLLYEDAKYLKDNVLKSEIKENIHCLALASNNLMYNKTRGLAQVNNNKEGVDIYCFTDIGKKLDRYGLSYNDESRYGHISNGDEPLENQKLNYVIVESADGKLF